MDLLSSLMEVLMPQAHAAAPIEAPVPNEPRFNFTGGMLAGLPQSQPAQPPPGLSVGNGPLPVAESLRGIFAPQPASAPPPMRPPVMRAPMPAAAPPPPDNQITGADVQRFIRSVATGAGRADPRAPGVSAFAQGAMGATQNSYAELEREKTQKLAERRADIADRRADAALSLQASRDQRAEDEFNRKVKRDEAVDRERQVRTQERLARIAKISDTRLDAKDIGRIGDQVNRHARYLQVEVNNARMTPEQAEQSLDQYKRDVIEQYVTRNPAARASPRGNLGTGAQDAPHRFDGLDPDAAKKRFNDLKPGDYYVNPADGRTYKKN